MFNAVNLVKGIIYRAALDYVEITKRQMKKKENFRFTKEGGANATPDAESDKQLRTTARTGLRDPGRANRQDMTPGMCSKELAELEEFFRGPLVVECLGLDGDEIIERLQARARILSGAPLSGPFGATSPRGEAFGTIPKGEANISDLQRILDGQGGRMSADKFLELCRSRGVKVIASANGEAEEIKCASDWVDVIEKERLRQGLKKSTVAAYIGLQSGHYCNMLSRKSANTERLAEYSKMLGIRVELVTITGEPSQPPDGASVSRGGEPFGGR